MVKIADVAGEPEKTFRIHVGLVLSQILCWPAFAFELSRALSGNRLSWAYVFEWPFLACYAIYMWRRMINEAHGKVRVKKVRPGATETPAAEDDPELRAWNEYLARVHQSDVEKED
jgi:hypothetical protein